MIDVWKFLSLLGTTAFALSGGLVAIEEKFDVLGVFVLAFVTAFGGGAIRNSLVGLPVSLLWNQSLEIDLAFFVVLLLILFPNKVLVPWKKAEQITDAIGLAAFSVQGAISATHVSHSLSAVIVAAVLTGAGGGVVRDLLAGRKPVVLRSEIYAAWSILGALCVHFKIAHNDLSYLLLVFVLALFRVLGYYRHWHLPKISIGEKKAVENENS